MSKFQIFFIAIFAALAVIGLIAFSTFKGKSGNKGPTIVMWGTLDQVQMQKFLTAANDSKTTGINITYAQKKEDTFDQTLTEAIATGQGPDMILVSQDRIAKNANKLRLISYDNYSENSFKTNFVQISSLFQRNGGIIAVPFAIDPMVMYWNRDIFNNSAIALPPKTWAEVTDLVPTFTKKTGLSISQSTIALGEFVNINHAKDIISLLMIQAGNPLTAIDSNNQVVSTLVYGNGPKTALSFYTQFANPVKTSYTWNRALIFAKELFIANRMAMYLGYSSEYTELRSKNPNLNFDVTYMPQTTTDESGLSAKTTYAKVYAMAVTNVSSNTNVYTVLGLLSSANSASIWNQITGQPSVRRDVNTVKSNDATSVVFSTSAFWSKGWLDPNSAITSQIFRTMIENITSGKMIIEEAITQASGELSNNLNI